LLLLREGFAVAVAVVLIVRLAVRDAVVLMLLVVAGQ